MKLFSASRNHESASFLWISIEKKTGKTTLSEASLQSFQLQLEAIVLAVLLVSSSEQQCSDEREHIFYDR
jgi:hypothetical protein